MPKYRIQTEDGRTFMVDADSQDLALSALGMGSASQPDRDSGLTLSDLVTGKKPYQAEAEKAVAKTSEMGIPFLNDMAHRVTQGMTLGWGDEMSAGLRSIAPNTTYAKEKAIQDAIERRATKNTGAVGTAAEVAGGLATGLGAAGGGMTLLRGGQRLLPRIAGGAVEGAGYGAVQGAGSAEGGRAKGAANGAMWGAGLGAALPLAAAGARMASPLLSSIEAWRNPGAYADRKIAQTLERSGRTEQDVLNEMTDAGGQPYALADALDYEGRRLLSTVTKAPGAGRREALDFLHERQADQPERVVSYLREGFDAPRTAKQAEDALRAQRKAEADVNYGAARNSARYADPSEAIRLADEVIDPGTNALFGNNSRLRDDTVESVVRAARDMLTNGSETLTDFRSLFRVKRDIDAMIDSANPTQQRELIPIRNALDDALANASDPYAAARNRFREQSRQIEAVDAGREAAGPALAADAVPPFTVRPADQQAPFRTGFVDPVITRIMNTAAPGANRAKFSPNMQTKLEAFAEPSRAQDLLDRLTRERRMHSTLTEAAGGSKTVENAADAADMGIDPAILSNLLSGQFKSAGLAAGRGVWNAISGNTEPVRNELASRLLPLAGSEPLGVMLPRVTKALRDKRRRNDAIELGLIRGLLTGGAEEAGRLQ
jgi:hypothetical protein